MITLTIICVIYTFFGFRSFKKQYGDYDIFNEPPDTFTYLLVFTSIFSLVMGIYYITKYLP